MEPWLSWPIFLGVGATAWYYYTRPARSRPGRTQGKESSPKDGTQRRQEKKQDSASDTTTPDGKSTSRAESSQGKKRKQPRERDSTRDLLAGVQNEAPASQEDDPDVEDQEWAKQLQAAKQGVTMKSSPKAGGQGTPRSTKKRDVENLSARQSNEALRSSEQTTAPSQLPASQGVSDMLEPAPAGPSIIRLTGEEKPKKQAPKKEEPAKETKKQRQNRQKVEERKVVREQEEQERKVLEERQRRTAREARGEPAKNGLGIAQPPTSNAWSKTSSDSVAAPAQQQSLRPNENPLLDTFDQDTTSTTSSNDQQHSTHTPVTAASMSSQDLISEEAQLEALKEMNGDAGWNEVKKSKKGKKKVPVSPPVEPGVKEDVQVSNNSAKEAINGSAKVPGLPTKSTEPANDYAALRPVTSLKPSMKAHPDDSDWAVE